MTKHNGEFRTFHQAHALRRFIGESRAGMVLANAQGGIWFSNQAADDLWGFPLEGRLITDLMDDETAQRHATAFSRFLDSATLEAPYLGHDHFWQARRGDGTTFKVGLRVTAWKDPFVACEPTFGAWLWEPKKGSYDAPAGS